MIKKSITYTDYDGNQRTDECYFNLSKAELAEMEVSEAGGFDKFLEKVVETQDTKRIYAIFKEIILMSYGEKSHDGKHFIKKKTVNGEVIRLRDEFEQTEAFSEFIMEMLSNETAAGEFVTGVLPKELADEVAKQVASNKNTDKK